MSIDDKVTCLLKQDLIVFLVGALFFSESIFVALFGVWDLFFLGLGCCLIMFAEIDISKVISKYNKVDSNE